MMSDLFPTVILAGGLATRLGERTQSKPKSLVEIGGTPFIDLQLSRLAKLGVARVHICIGHLGDQIRNFVGDGAKFGIQVTYSEDGPVKLGTGGALSKALNQIKEDFFVVYGDTFPNLSFRSMQSTFQRQKPDALMAYMRNPETLDQSNVRPGEPPLIEYVRGDSDVKFIDYGVSILKRETLINFFERQSWELPEYFEAISTSKKLFGHECFERFYEIGSDNGIKDFEKYAKKHNLQSITHR
jgi:N-acetyl-alpha-D-muramate 1-phosphate uridylyltransferase